MRVVCVHARPALLLSSSLQVYQAEDVVLPRGRRVDGDLEVPLLALSVYGRVSFAPRNAWATPRVRRVPRRRPVATADGSAGDGVVDAVGDLGAPPCDTATSVVVFCAGPLLMGPVSLADAVRLSRARAADTSIAAAPSYFAVAAAAYVPFLGDATDGYPAIASCGSREDTLHCSRGGVFSGWPRRRSQRSAVRQWPPWRCSAVNVRVCMCVILLLVRGYRRGGGCGCGGGVCAKE